MTDRPESREALASKNHINTQHEPDNFVEKSAFNRAIYHKTWKVRGMQEPLSTLNLYKAKNYE